MGSQQFWRGARLLGGVAILALVGWRLGSGPFLAAVDVVSAPALAAAVGIGLVTTVCSAWRWSLVARAFGVRLPLGAAVGSYYRGLFLNAVLPGGVLGDVHRAVRHGRDVGDVSLAARAVVLERAAGQVVLVAASAAVLLAAPPALPLPGWLPSWGLLAGAAAVGALVPAAVLTRTLTRRRAAPGRWAAAVRRWAGDVRRGLGSGPGFLAIVLASAVVLAGHLATFLVAARVAGSAVPFARLAPLMLLALLAMSLPLNIGGWGPREGASAWAFAAAGLNADQGLTVAVVYGLFALAASLPGAAVLAARRVTAAATPQQVQPNR